MLAGENLHRIVEHNYVIYTAFLGTFTLVVNDCRLWEIIVVVAAQSNAVRQVNVLAVHEKCLVEQTYFLQGLGTQKHKCTRQHINLVDFVLVEISKMVFAKLFRLREKFRQAENLVERHLGCRQTAFRLGQETTFAVNHLHSQPTGIGMRVHKVANRLQSILFNYRIGI